MSFGVAESKKISLIRILQILKEETDQEHFLTQEEIINLLKERYGISIERKAVSKNLSLLTEAGFAIKKKSRKGVWLDRRDSDSLVYNFEDAEVRYLIDAVLASRHIDLKESNELIEKLCALTNRYFVSHMDHVHSVDEWNKTSNREFLLNIECIDEAITKKKQIEVDFNAYGVSKKLEYVRTLTLSPYQMLLHNQRYYLMAKNEKYGNIMYIRMEHLTNIRIIEKKASPIRTISGFEKGIQYKNLSTSLPYLYPDTPETVRFDIKTEAVDEAFEWFGDKLTITPSKNEGKVTIVVKTSKMAMTYWAMQYSGIVEVLSPADLRETIKEKLKNGYMQYT